MSARTPIRKTLAWMLLGITVVVLAQVANPSYKVLYNPSSSAPVGWYALLPPREIAVGELVFARLPSSAARLAAERGYLPRSAPLLKRVAATQGHRVCIRFNMIAVDGVLVGYALTRDGAGRALEHWSGCRSLSEDELFLLSADNPDSFDSRYFGPINAAAVLGKAIPLWTW